MTLSPAEVIADTQSWIKKAVIGLNLCPFAQGVYLKNQIRYVVSTADNVEQLLKDVKAELTFLEAADPKAIDTTLVIHPGVLKVFIDFNEFLGVVDQVLIDEDLDTKLQIASFHPFYQFADTSPDDIQNYTNRSPFPTLQILREASVEEGLKNFTNPDSIFEANIKTLQRLGYEGWKKLVGDQPS